MQRAQAARARVSALWSPLPAAAWLACAAVCTASSFTPRIAPVTAWAMYPCALEAFLAASSSLSPAVFFLTFVAAQAAASTVGLWGILAGPGVSPLVGNLALVPIAVAVWLLLALPFALQVAFARRYAQQALARRTATDDVMRRFCGSPVAVLVGPAAWTAVWTALGELSPLGAFLSPAASQAQGPFAQLAAVLGGEGIVFLLAWPGAALRRVRHFAAPSCLRPVLMLCHRLTSACTHRGCCCQAPAGGAIALQRR